jgi:nitrogen regulatory protein PII
LRARAAVLHFLHADAKSWMNLVTAIIRPEKLEAVRRALGFAYVTGMTVSEVQGFGRQRGHASTYRAAEYKIDFRPKLAVEIAVRARDLDAVIAAILRSAGDGKLGDGKIFVVPLENVVRIRTGEQGPDVL